MLSTSIIANRSITLARHVRRFEGSVATENRELLVPVVAVPRPHCRVDVGARFQLILARLVPRDRALRLTVAALHLIFENFPRWTIRRVVLRVGELPIAESPIVPRMIGIGERLLVGGLRDVGVDLPPSIAGSRVILVYRQGHRERVNRLGGS